MDHEMHAAAAELSSTFEGHVLPGAMFIVWAVYWIAQAFARGHDGGPAAMLEAGLVLPVLKVALPLFGVLVEIPGQGWYPMDVAMSWQHVTMYSAFVLTGLVDLLARKGVLSGAATYVAFAAAHTNAGFLFWGHGAHGGVEGLVHKLLALAFFAVALVAAAEAVRPGASLKWMRIGAQLVLGSWFVVAGWILYRSGWDLADPIRESWANMAFSWLIMAMAAVTIGTLILARRSSARPAVQDA